MTRRQQDILTWAIAVVLLLSQLTPWAPRRPELTAGAFGLLGLIPARKLQDAVNRQREEEAEP